MDGSEETFWLHLH